MLCVSIESATGTSQAKGESEKPASSADRVKVFPNPNNGTFNVIASSGFADEARPNGLSGRAIALNIEIYNVLGEKVFTSTLPPPNGGGASFAYEINISSQPNGVYFYRVVKEDGELVGEGKVIIQK